MKKKRKKKWWKVICRRKWEMPLEEKRVNENEGNNRKSEKRTKIWRETIKWQFIEKNKSEDKRKERRERGNGKQWQEGGV